MENLRFKFRAWHKGANQMLHSHDQGYQGEVFKWLHEGQPVELMQFTGLRDKNGKEIYEGDITRTESEKIYVMSGHPSGNISIKLSEIVWLSDGTWGYKHIANIQNVNYTLGFITRGIAIHAKYSEVIGNVFENSELKEQE